MPYAAKSDAAKKIPETLETMESASKETTESINPLCSIVNAFSSLGVGFGDDSDSGDKSFFEELKEKVESAVKTLNKVMSDAMDAVNSFMTKFNAVMNALVAKFEELAEAGLELIDKLVTAAETYMTEAIEAVKEAFTAGLNYIKDAISSMTASISSAFDGLSLSKCKTLSEAAEDTPESKKTDAMKAAKDNKGKSDGQFVKDSIKASPATSKINSLKSGSDTVPATIESKKPTVDGLRSAIESDSSIKNSEAYDATVWS